MTCPACDYELSVDRDFCENCGAPTYLATAIQASELTHCTYCGAREPVENNLCPTCGLKKNFKTLEKAVGLCRNCGATWRNRWRYCQICGVARENGLVEMTMSSQPLPVALVSISGQHSHSFN